MSGGSLIGTGLQMFGQVEAGKASARALKDQANSAESNAKAAQLKAQADAELQVIQSRKILGEQETGFAASGVSGGSALAVLADSKINAEMDRLSILFDGDIRSANFRSEARSLRRQGSEAKRAGVLGAITAGFQGGGQALSSAKG